MDGGELAGSLPAGRRAGEVERSLANAGAPAPVLFVHYGEDWIRGSERVLLDLLAHLDRRRFRPVVWCNAPVLAREIAALGIDVTTSRFPILLDWSAPRFDVPGFRALVREARTLVRAHGIRLVHANSGAPCQWMVPAGRAERIPVLGHLHANYDLRGRCIFLLHHVTLAIGCSAGTLQGLTEDGVPPERMRVVYNGLDFERLAGGDARRLRAELGIAPDDVVVVSVGSLIHRKGFDVLLRAFVRVRAEAPHVRLLVVGDGPDRAALAALARELDLGDAVRFLGERHDTGALFRDVADVAALASRDEAIALSILEPLWARRPVVATRVGGVAEAVDDGVSGLLVPSEQPEALAAALLRAAADADLRRRMGEAGHARILRDFTVQRSVERLGALHDELLAIPAGRLGWSGPWGPWRPWARLAAASLGRRLGRGPRPSGARGRAAVLGPEVDEG